jgi:hypothetical protein
MGGKSLCGNQSWTLMRQLYTAGEGSSFKGSFFLLFSYEKVHLVPRKVEIMHIRKQYKDASSDIITAKMRVHFLRSFFFKIIGDIGMELKNSRERHPCNPICFILFFCETLYRYNVDHGNVPRNPIYHSIFLVSLSALLDGPKLHPLYSNLVVSNPVRLKGKRGIFHSLPHFYREW